MERVLYAFRLYDVADECGRVRALGDSGLSILEEGIAQTLPRIKRIPRSACGLHARPSVPFVRSGSTMGTSVFSVLLLSFLGCVHRQRDHALLRHTRDFSFRSLSLLWPDAAGHSRIQMGGPGFRRREPWHHFVFA